MKLKFSPSGVTAIGVLPLVASLTAAQAAPLHTHFGTLLDEIDVSPYLDVCDKVANTPWQRTSWTITVAGQQLSYTMNWECEDHKLSIDDNGWRRYIARPGSAQHAAEVQTCDAARQCHTLVEWRQLTAQLCARSRDADALMREQQHWLANRWYNTPQFAEATHQMQISNDADQKCWSARATLAEAQRRVEAATANETR